MPRAQGHHGPCTWLWSSIHRTQNGKTSSHYSSYYVCLSGPPLFAKTAGKSIQFETTRFWNDQQVETTIAVLSTRIMNVSRPSAIHWTVGTRILFGTTLSHPGKFPITSREWFKLKADTLILFVVESQDNSPKTISPFTTERNGSRLLSVERAPFEADERAADHRAIVKANERAAEHRDIVKDQRTSSGTPRQRRRPTNEQRITAPSLTRKERLRTPIRRASPIKNHNSNSWHPANVWSRPPLFRTRLNRHQRQLKESSS